MRTASKFIILMWLSIPFFSIADVWLIGESPVTRLFLCCLEMSFLTAGYLLGRQEYSKQKKSLFVPAVYLKKKALA